MAQALFGNREGGAREGEGAIRWRCRAVLGVVGRREALDADPTEPATPDRSRARSGLHAAGLRFRKHYRPVKGSRCEVDVAFTRWRVAVLLDGCFWHGCPQHATRPATNEEWWAAKLRRQHRGARSADRRDARSGWLDGPQISGNTSRPAEVVTKVCEVIAGLSVGAHRPRRGPLAPENAHAGGVWAAEEGGPKRVTEREHRFL